MLVGVNLDPRRSSTTSKSAEGLGQTVEKPRVQPGKTVPWEFPRAQPEGTPEGQFFQAALGFSTVSQTLLIP